jgi:LPXTG-motif cell wall-anchored protein
MSKALLACLIVLGACALVAPSAALAGGPSAGDQQYIDPLAGSGHHGSSSSHHGSTTPTAPASSTSSGSTSSGATSTSSAASPGAATTASPSATTTASSNPKGHDPSAGLPKTGFDALLVALIGALLLGAGALLALVARRV